MTEQQGSSSPRPLSPDDKQIMVTDVIRGLARRASEVSIAVSDGLRPKTVEEIYLASALYFHSGMTKFKSITETFVAIDYGTSLGFTVGQAVQSIAVIKGKTSLYGDAVPGLIMDHKELAEFKEWFDGDEGKDNRTAHCTITRERDRGEGKPTLRVTKTWSYSIAKAKKAGLLPATKWRDGRWVPAPDSPWETNTDRMLQMRARAFAVRDVFPDVMQGLGVREEFEGLRTQPDPDDDGGSPLPTTGSQRVGGKGPKVMKPENVIDVDARVVDEQTNDGQHIDDSDQSVPFDERTPAEKNAEVQAEMGLPPDKRTVNPDPPAPVKGRTVVKLIARVEGKQVAESTRIAPTKWKCIIRNPDGSISRPEFEAKVKDAPAALIEACKRGNVEVESVKGEATWTEAEEAAAEAAPAKADEKPSPSPAPTKEEEEYAAKKLGTHPVISAKDWPEFSVSAPPTFDDLVAAMQRRAIEVKFDADHGLAENGVINYHSAMFDSRLGADRKMTPARAVELYGKIRGCTPSLYCRR